MTNLTPEELQEPRTASDFLPWVQRRIEEIGAAKGGKRAIRFRHGLVKPLVEEALPLGIFASKHFAGSEHITLQLVLGNQNYDAIVQDERDQSGSLTYIEVTQAHEGENEHLRMMVLEEKGHVNPIGVVRKDGTKVTGIQVVVENEAINHGTVLESEFRKIEEAIRRKQQKSYPPGTALLVMFDDYISMQHDDDVIRLRDRVQPLLSDLSAFVWLAVVGWSGRIFEEFDLVSSKS
jgi:hypothetical protein